MPGLTCADGPRSRAPSRAHGARAEVLDHRVRARATSRRNAARPAGALRSSATDSLLRLSRANGELCPSEERAGGPDRVRAGRVLDLDHPGAEVGELHGGERRGHEHARPRAPSPRSAGRRDRTSPRLRLRRRSSGRGSLGPTPASPALVSAAWLPRTGALLLDYGAARPEIDPDGLGRAGRRHHRCRPAAGRQQRLVRRGRAGRRRPHRARRGQQPAGRVRHAHRPRLPDRGRGRRVGRPPRGAARLHGRGRRPRSAWARSLLNGSPGRPRFAGRRRGRAPRGHRRSRPARWSPACPPRCAASSPPTRWPAIRDNASGYVERAREYAGSAG